MEKPFPSRSEKTALFGFSRIAVSFMHNCSQFQKFCLQCFVIYCYFSYVEVCSRCAPCGPAPGLRRPGGPRRWGAGRLQVGTITVAYLYSIAMNELLVPHRLLTA
jgi:hypothetical protein